jgi:hypothetical protein
MTSACDSGWSHDVSQMSQRWHLRRECNFPRTDLKCGTLQPAVATVQSHHVSTRGPHGLAVGRCLLLLIGVCLGACAGDDGIDRGASERASAVVVDNRRLFREWSVSPEPVLRIGVSDGAPSYQFYRVRFAARLQDGRMVVVDGSSCEIRWYDASGRHRASVGRRGEGPGEFRDIRSGVLTAGDTLVVHDVRNQRVTWLSPAERIVREEPLTGVGGSDVRLLNVLEQGRVVISQPRSVIAFGASDFTYTRDSLAILLYSPAKLDTIVEMDVSSQNSDAISL